jgi:hypothetical protein
VRVLVVTNLPAPFEQAIDDEVAVELARTLVDESRQVEVMRLPFGLTRDPERGFATVRLIDYTLFADTVICLSAVATVLRHPRKIAWFDPARDRPLVPGYPALDDRLLAECAVRLARTAQGLADLRARNLDGSIMAVPSDPARWSDVARKVTS